MLPSIDDTFNQEGYSFKTRKQPKDAESSSGISESEEEEDEEDPQEKKKADQTPIHKEDVIKRGLSLPSEMGHFQVAVCLGFEVSLGAQLL